MNKQQIRKLYSEKRKQLSAELIADLTAGMVAQFRGIPLTAYQTVLSYSPIEHRKEFNVAACEEVLAVQAPAARIAHPRIIGDSDFMEAVVVNKATSFVHNGYAIREPAHGDILTPESFDLVLVPLLAFDMRGYRVGYGKGFYDRWLAQCRPGVFKIGFSYFEPVDTIDDVNEFDVPLNICITPARIYEF